MRITRANLRLLGAAVTLTGLASCSSEPTSQTSDPSFATTTTYLTIQGPGAVTAPGRTAYNYIAHMGASYPTFLPWGVRTCPTKSITGCTVPWTTVYGTTINTYWNQITQYLSENCGNAGRMTFQVRAQAYAFALATQTAYLVTSLCRGV